MRLGISNNRIGVRMFEIGGIEDNKQLANAIRYRAQEVLPILLEEAVLDYHVLGEYTDGEGTPSIESCWSSPIGISSSATRPPARRGIRLAGIDLEAFAILRALAPDSQAVEAGTPPSWSSSVGHDRTTFAVSDGKACQFTRVLDWGGASLNAGTHGLSTWPRPRASRSSFRCRSPSRRFRRAHERAVGEGSRGGRPGAAHSLSSSPSLQFYQSQPALWASARSS